MSVVAPPEPPRQDELEALIPEARARQRRRVLLIAAGVFAAVGVGLAVRAVLGGGSSVAIRGHGPITAAAGHVASGPEVRRGIGDVGSGGGVTWAINGHGIWLTTNDGRAWRRSVPRGIAAARIAVASPPEIQFVDRQVGWMSAPLAFDRQELSTKRRHWEFDRTTDGGRTWHLSMPPGCSRVCYDGSFSFLDARHGFLFAAVQGAGAPNKLFRTSDGGRSWQLVSRPSIWGPITFVNDRDGFAGGPGEIPVGVLTPMAPIITLYRTTDGGRTWSKYDPAGTGSFTQPPVAVGGRVFVVENGPNRNGGLNLAAGTVFASADGGSHWNGHAVPFGRIVSVWFSAASPSVWALSARGDLFLTDHAGHGWRKIVVRGLPRNGQIRKIDFTSRRDGWAILGGLGVHSTLVHTSDGGRHWTPAGPRVRRQAKHG